ncbi:hypothetical protein B5F32_05370 [Parabacteroides distasonis]|uniref:Glycosyltransferase 2-like domain-containing protein n=1 Tax=Parabacteroides distasonis TaxID=823 RepID=A0A1Y4ILN0_PARDI|nr:glycosyltransferase family 2 protein [Parabacteroides distasonis]OUP21235.1 hypothetical protein B5F32_05370 [Parabacteroides distasonis]
MKPKISIIVPVYNACEYLERCLSSVLFQSFPDFELLLINDGSTDGSLEICRRYEKMDRRIRFFNRSNHGVSATRQFGIDHCQGKYCIQIDSDDWIDINYLQKMYEKAIETSSEIVCASIYKEFTNKNICVPMLKANTVDRYLTALLCGKGYGFIWNKLILTELFKKNGIKFPISVCMWEDYAFVVKCLMCAKSIAFCDGVYYHYTQYNDNSLCSTISRYDMPSHTIAAISDIDRFMKSIGKYDIYKKKLAITKQYAKQKLLFDSHFRNLKKWYSVFPESNRYFLPFIYCALRGKLFPTY